MLYYFKKGKNAIEMQKKCAVYEEDAVTDLKRQKWFVKFHAGDFSLDNVPQSGGPVEVDSNQIKTLTENNKHYSMQGIADILKISKTKKIIGENEKYVFYFIEKPKWTFWPTQ